VSLVEYDVMAPKIPLPADAPGLVWKPLLLSVRLMFLEKYRWPLPNLDLRTANPGFFIVDLSPVGFPYMSAFPSPSFPRRFHPRLVFIKLVFSWDCSSPPALIDCKRSAVLKGLIRPTFDHSNLFCDAPLFPPALPFYFGVVEQLNSACPPTSG